MARARDPNRDKAFEIWKQSNGEIKLKDIAEQLGISEGTVRGWKNKDKWDGQANGTFQSKERNGAKKGTERSNGTERKAGELSWAEIENEYVTDIRRKPCSLEDLSKKYNIPLQTVFDQSAANEWSRKRKEFKEKTKQKAIEKTAEKVSDDIARITARHLRLSDKLLAVIEESLEDDEQFYKYVEKIRTGYGPGEFDEKVEVTTLASLNESKLLSTVSAMEKLQKMQRQTLGIIDEKDRTKIEMDQRRLFGEGEEENEDDGFLDALDGKVEQIWDDDDE